MPRYIDADKLKERLMVGSELDPEPCKGFRSALLAMVDSQEDADVVERKDLDKITEAHEQIGYEKGYRDGYAQAKVEVVRCKECKHSLKRQLGYGCEMNFRLCTNGNWFCADGERKDDE